jgi:hypothetical protein
MQKEVQALNKERDQLGLPLINAGIGMHTGSLIMGITGDEFRLDAATISDTVNSAARIESLTKYYRSPLLLSQETMDQLSGKQQFNFRHLGSVKLKGKNKLLNIIECFDGYDEKEFDKKLKTLPAFNEAMNYYLDQQFENASQIFQSILETDSTDLTVKFFLENALKFVQEGVPENWTGAVEMASK